MVNSMEFQKKYILVDRLQIFCGWGRGLGCDSKHFQIIIEVSNILDSEQAPQNVGPGPEVIKLFSYSTQLITKFILLINVKMPIIVGILTFISMINTTSKIRKARNFFIFRYFSFYEQLNFCAQLT